MESLGSQVAKNGKSTALLTSIEKIYKISQQKLSLIPANQMPQFLQSLLSNRRDEKPKAIEKYFVAGGGWKIHLHVSADNRPIVFEYLMQNVAYCFKNQGAGDQVGKDFTIYVGSYMHMMVLAKLLSEQLQSYLNDATEDLRWSDIEVESRVFARFEVIGRHRPEFHQYGYGGIAWLHDDFGQHYVMKNPSFPVDLCMRRAHSRLFELYGKYYSGQNNELMSKISKLLI